MNNEENKIDSKSHRTISARIDMDIYQYFQEAEIPMTNIVKILLRGFVTSGDKLGMLLRCLEDDRIIRIDADEAKLDSFAKERLGLSLWDEKFIKLYRDLKDLP